MKPKLKPPGTKRLKLEYDGLLSNLGFKFNLRRYNLEQQCAKLAISVAKEGERQRTSTMAWIVDHFWLRRKVHLKTLANSVRWMIKGSYKSGMTEAVLRAKEAAEGRKGAEAGAYTRSLISST